jgi:hypothetical protein
MNASDIVKLKQNGALYKAYYRPTVFQSTVYSTITPVSSLSTNTTSGGIRYQSSFTSCINTAYTYSCEPPFISYELAKDIAEGSYVCGGKTVSKMTWKANMAIPTQDIYAYSTYSTPSSISLVSTVLSVNSYAVRPLICPDPIFNQGTNFANTCTVCNNFGAGVNACCYNCASGH